MAILSLSVMIASCSERKIDLDIEFVSVKNFDKEKIIEADFSGDELISINLISKYSIRNYINSHKIDPYVEISYCQRYDFDEERKIRSVSSIFDKNGRVEYGVYSDGLGEIYKYTIFV
ncbi:hypothetical protein [Zavarzinia sp.]|uniref:hypothetical protein n=1 Tax=Zavarzinia sp. TaxID=2027920 RepID=UPI003BB5AB86